MAPGRRRTGARQALACAATYFAGAAALAPRLVRDSVPDAGSPLLLAALAMALACAGGWAARWAAKGGPTLRLRAAAGVCLGTLAAVLLGLARLPGTSTAAAQAALLIPMVAGLLLLLPAAALAERVARGGLAAGAQA